MAVVDETAMTEFGINRIEVFNSDRRSDKNVEFNFPCGGITFDTNDNIIVADRANHS